MASLNKVEKLRSKKYYSCYKNIQVVIYNLIFSSLLALTCSLLCSLSPIASTKHFLFTTLPSIWSYFLNPKCLFIVFNVIVAFLVGESKLLGRNSSSPINDIYSEYVERVQRNRKYLNSSTATSVLHEANKVYQDKQMVVAVELKKEEQHHDNDEAIKTVDQEEEDHDDVEEFKEAEDQIGNDNNNNDDEIKVGEEEEEGESEGLILPAEELNQRVEAFIARINKQRWIEARMLICGQA